MERAKKSKLKNTIGKILEPVALGLLALLFIIPTITVINLEPITGRLKDFTDVLGVTSGSGVIVDIVGGTHQIISSERIQRISDEEYKYEAILTKRDSDFYSKPILQIRNNSDEDKTITFSGFTINPTRSEIGLIIQDQAYRLQDSRGQTSNVEVLIRAGSMYDVYLTVESLIGVQFSEDFEMKITIR